MCALPHPTGEEDGADGAQGAAPPPPESPGKQQLAAARELKEVLATGESLLARVKVRARPCCDCLAIVLSAHRRQRTHTDATPAQVLSGRAAQLEATARSLEQDLGFVKDELARLQRSARATAHLAGDEARLACTRACTRAWRSRLSHCAPVGACAPADSLCHSLPSPPPPPGRCRRGGCGASVVQHPGRAGWLRPWRRLARPHEGARTRCELSGRVLSRELYRRHMQN